jgi:hypothetical protein
LRGRSNHHRRSLRQGLWRLPILRSNLTTRSQPISASGGGSAAVRTKGPAFGSGTPISLRCRAVRSTDLHRALRGRCFGTIGTGAQLGSTTLRTISASQWHATTSDQHRALYIVKRRPMTNGTRRADSWPTTASLARYSVILCVGIILGVGRLLRQSLRHPGAESVLSRLAKTNFPVSIFDCLFVCV